MKDYNFNVDKLELKYLIDPIGIFDTSIDNELRQTHDDYKHLDFTFKKRTSINLKNKSRDKYLYYRQVFSVLYKNDYVFEIYFDPYNDKIIKDKYLRIRVLNNALYLKEYSIILKSLEDNFNLNYQGYTQIDIAFDVAYNIQEHLKLYFDEPKKYSINYNNRPLEYLETFGKEYRNGDKNYTVYLKSKTDYLRSDTVIYNKTKEVSEKGKDFLLRFINNISRTKDVFRIEIQLNEKSKFSFNRFLLIDKTYLEEIYTKQFNKMLDIRLIEHTRNKTLKKRCRCEKINFLLEIKAKGKKNPLLNE